MNVPARRSLMAAAAVATCNIGMITAPTNRRRGELVNGLRKPDQRLTWVSRNTGRPVKVGRNAPCPCKSGKKFKACCLGKKPEVLEAKQNGRQMAVTK